MHGVAVGDGPVEQLQQQQAAALTAHIAVRPCVEGVTASGRGEGADPRGDQRGVECQVEADAAGQRGDGLAAAQAPPGEMHGDQRRRLAGVDELARAAQAEGVREPVGDEGPLGAGQRVVRDRGGRLPPQRGVVVPARADEHAGAGARERGGQQTRVLDGLPAQFQGEPLLRVHRGGFAGRDAEEGRVEGVGVLDESAPSRARGVRGRGGVELGGRPAVRRRFGDGVPSVEQQPPESVGVGRSGQTARIADDRDGILRRDRSGQHLLLKILLKFSPWPQEELRKHRQVIFFPVNRRVRGNRNTASLSLRRERCRNMLHHPRAGQPTADHAINSLTGQGCSETGNTKPPDAIRGKEQATPSHGPPSRPIAGH